MAFEKVNGGEFNSNMKRVKEEVKQEEVNIDARMHCWSPAKRRRRDTMYIPNLVDIKQEDIQRTLDESKKLSDEVNDYLKEAEMKVKLINSEQENRDLKKQLAYYKNELGKRTDIDTLASLYNNLDDKIDNLEDKFTMFMNLNALMDRKLNYTLGKLNDIKAVLGFKGSNSATDDIIKKSDSLIKNEE